MAEGLLRHMAGDRFEVASAGTSPARVRPEAIEAMREIGIAISTHRSKSVDEFAGRTLDYVITVCDNANEQCPLFPSETRRIHWSFDDPATLEGDESARLAAFRRVRDEIKHRLQEWTGHPVNPSDELWQNQTTSSMNGVSQRSTGPNTTPPSEQCSHR